jgi:hypothetical protein
MDIIVKEFMHEWEEEEAKKHRQITQGKGKQNG